MRPTIRPVKPTAPPPPPSPPRRFSSGIRRPIENDAEIPTTAFNEPPTMAAGRLRAVSREQRFDDETQARPADDPLVAAPHWSTARRANLDVPYEALPSLEVREASYDSHFDRDAETKLRPESDDYRNESEPPPARRFGSSGAYAARTEDSGPRQRPRKDAGRVPQYDLSAYEANYPGVQREEARREGSHSARGSSYQPPQSSSRSRERSFPAQQHADDGFRDRKDSWSASHPQIPPAPPVPREMSVPSGFVMGVQPLRTPAASPAYVPSQPQVIVAPTRTPRMGVPYASANAPMGTPARSFPTPAPAPVHVRQPSNRSVYSQHPIGHQLQMTELEEAQQGSKVGRFAWFVFGAAFGIFFAFFATGFVPRLSKKEEAQFPPPPVVQPQAVATTAPAQPTAVTPAQPTTPTVQAPAAQAPVAQPSAAQPAPVAQPQAVASAPVTTPPVAAPQPAAPPPAVAAPQPAAAAPVAAAPQAAAPAPQPVAAAPAPAPKPNVDRSPRPAPRGQRAATIARRSPPPPAPAGPKPLPNSGSTDADDMPAPKTSSKSKGDDLGSITNLLSAGLGD